MKSSHLLLLGSFVGVSAALVAWKEFQTDSSVNSEGASDPMISNHSSPKVIIGDSDQKKSHRREVSPFIISETLTLDENASIQSEENLERLKAGSERRLKQLERGLFLSPDQSREIYSLIARSSPLFTPGISINGYQPPALTPTAATGEVHDLLDPVQQGDYVDDLLAEKEWWDDLVAELETEIDADLTPSSPALDQSPTKQEEQTPFNLFKNLSEE